MLIVVALSELKNSTRNNAVPPDGRVYLNVAALKKYRQQLGLSQMGLSDYAVSIRLPLSIASIKRAELGKPVIYRTALQLARIFKEDVSTLISGALSAEHPPFGATTSAETTSQQCKMVGRKGEFKYITHLLQETRTQGTGKFIYVRGVAGIGKSRLLEEASRNAQQHNFQVVQCKFDGAMLGEGVITLAALVRACLGVEGRENADITPLAVQHWLQARGVQDDTHLYLCSLLGLALTTSELEIYTSLSNETRVDKICQALLRLLKFATHDQRFVVIIEDVHWASDPMLTLLGQVVCEARQLPVAWVMASRHENDPLELKIHPYLFEQSVHIVDVPPLSAQEASALAAQIQPTLTEQQALSVEQSKGNPLFLTQLLLRTDSALLPSKLLDIVDFKLSLLTPLDLQALQIAAAVQHDIPLAMWRALLDDAHYQPVLPLKLRIVRKLDQRTYAYTYDLVLRGVLDRTPPHVLKAQHKKIAAYYKGKDNTLHAIHLRKAQSSSAPAAML